MDYKDMIKETPDFPKAGILFRDVSPVLGNAVAFNSAINDMCNSYRKICDGFVGIDSRGFIFASAMATKEMKDLYLVRKAGKLPPPVEQVEYELEYGTAKIEMAPVEEKKKVYIVDDLLATGGSAMAAIELAEKCGFEVLGVICFVELMVLGGRDRIMDAGYEVQTIVQY